MIQTKLLASRRATNACLFVHWLSFYLYADRNQDICWPGLQENFSRVKAPRGYQRGLIHIPVSVIGDVDLSLGALNYELSHDIARQWWGMIILTDRTVTD